MASVISKLTKAGLIQPPSWLPHNIMYETTMGSRAYGVHTEDSDFDVLGFCMPPKHDAFPHLAGVIPGFEKEPKQFTEFQIHHVEHGKHEYDFKMYSIVKYFNLAMLNNPDVLDSLFTSQECVLSSTAIGVMVRERRKIFLHKGAWPKYRGYAYSQLHKMKGKNPEEGSKRDQIREEFGFDVKFAYHVVRLLGEIEQILTVGDIDLRQNCEQLKAIRRGDVSEDEIIRMAGEKEKHLERLYESSTLPWGPDVPAIKALLMECMEHHYGSLDKCVVDPDRAVQALRQINNILQQNQGIL